MRNFEFTAALDRSSVSIVMVDAGTGLRSVRRYSTSELYPLAGERYHRQLSNLFVDTLDLIDGFGPEGVPAGIQDGKGGEGSDPSASRLPKDVSAALKAPTVSLRTLVRRAQREVSDGSGVVGVRYADARGLWEAMARHALAGVVRTQDGPITDVRRNHNWRKHQPFALTRVDPQAWFVSGVYTRSNTLRDPIRAYRGLTAVLEACEAAAAESDGEAGEKREAKAGTRSSGFDRSTPEAVARAVTGNLDFPTYRQVATLLGDSNMLVFHSDESLADWIRTNDSDAKARTGEDPLGSGTPVFVRQRTWRGTRIVPGDAHPSVPALAEIPAGEAVTVANLANRLKPRESAQGE